MLTSETKIRVRYGECDPMGIVYYGNYLLYYEVARSEMLLQNGMSYSEIEKKGILLPVIHADLDYLSSGFYNDLLTVKSTLLELPLVKLKFSYEINNELGTIINKGSTTLVYLDAKTRRPCRAPEYFLDKMRMFF